LPTKGTNTACIPAEEAITTEALPRRTYTVGTRLSQEEVRQLTGIADSRQVKVGDVLRELVLAAIAQNTSARTPDPVLSEIVGVRLLLVNLLRPGDGHAAMTKESYEALLAEIKRVKKQVAMDIEREDERR
jgi:hypothetical protein